MRRETEGTILLAVAAVVFNLVISGAFQSYVRTGLGVPLLAAAALLAVVALPAVLRRQESPRRQTPSSITTTSTATWSAGWAS